MMQGEHTVQNDAERQSAARYFAMSDQAAAGALRAQWKEFVVRTVAPAPFDDVGGDGNGAVCVSRATLSRTYALIGRNDLRLATTLCVDEES